MTHEPDIETFRTDESISVVATLARAWAFSNIRCVREETTAF